MTDKQFTIDDVELIESKRVYDGFFKMESVQLKHRLFAGGWTPTITRELFVRGSAVAAILYDPKHKLIGLVEQFRIGLLKDAMADSECSPWCLEVVAGMAEVDEASEEVILRELQEEAGVTPQQLLFICDYYSSLGGTNEHLNLYCAIADLSQAGGLFGLEDESEDIRFVVMPELDVFNALYSGRYNNAATMIGLQWLQSHKDGLAL